MKLLIFVAALGFVSIASAQNTGIQEDVDNCHRDPPSIELHRSNGGFVRYDEESVPAECKNDGTETRIECHPCGKEMAKHIKLEMKAAITYLQLSAHFSSELFFRPGLAKFFLESAAEERGHAKKFMEYILMRQGEFTQIDGIEAPETKEWDVMEALKQAYKLEDEVTTSIRKLADACEASKEGVKINDYHAVDFLSGEFLAEQHESLRTISGYIATLQNLRDGVTNDALYRLNEIIFDQSLLAD